MSEKYPVKFNRETENPERLNWIAFLLLLVLFLILLCTSARKSYPIIAKKIEPSRFCSQYLDLLGEESRKLAFETETDQPYLKDKVIITGALSDINHVKKMIDTTDLSTGDKPIVKFPINFFSQNQPIVIAEYMLINGDVETYVNTFNDFVRTDNNDKKFPPFAEPNYIIREPRRFTTSGDPGSSNVEVDAAAPPVIADIKYKDFLNQWAFHQGQEYLHPDPSQGEDITIMVFDTSPLNSGEFLVELAAPNHKYGSRGPERYDLCVSAPISQHNGFSKSIFDSHGLFVTNLAHAVAPESRLVLVQVLQSTGENGDVEIKGDVFTLLNLMELYLNHATSQEQKVVVNLSLGFDFSVDNLDDNDFLADQIDLAKNRLENFAKCDCSPIFKPDMISEPDVSSIPVFSMHLLLYSLWNDARSNIVYIAAAGNDGKNVSQSPGDYPYFLSVAGSERNLQDGSIPETKSCFSNAGDLIAPAGRGKTDGEDCVINLAEDCVEPFECSSALTSLLLEAGGKAKFGYWAGTSFSTPLVSGLAAKLFAQTHDIKSDEVRCLIDPAPGPDSSPSNISQIQPSENQACP